MKGMGFVTTYLSLYKNEATEGFSRRVSIDSAYDVEGKLFGVPVSLKVIPIEAKSPDTITTLSARVILSVPTDM